MEIFALLLIIFLLVIGVILDKLTGFIDALKPFIRSSKFKHGFVTTFSFEPIHKKREVSGDDTTSLNDTND